MTLQPVERHGVDAAVLFADIMTPVLAMGVDVQLVEGVGPMVEHPFRAAADVERLRPLTPPEGTLEAIRLIRAELPSEKALVGFCGGPFTVACYLVEGRGSRDFLAAKELMYREPAVWHALLERLADGFAAYVEAQVDAGADVIQLFDSWAGILSPATTRSSPRPTRAACSRPSTCADDPLRHRHGRAALAHARRGRRRHRARLAGGARPRVGRPSALDRGVQGNLDPAVLLAPWPQVEEAARDVLRRADGRRGHVFNLGHGVLPQTDPDVLARLTELVQEQTA